MANTHRLFKNSDEAIVITIPDPAAITDAYATIKLAANFKERIFMLVNMAKNNDEAQMIFKRCKKSLKVT